MDRVATGALALSAALLASAATAAGPVRTVRCDIWQRNAIQYDGPCSLRPEGGGSFSLTFPHSEEAESLEQYHVTRIRVRLVRPRVAQVSEPDRRADPSWGRAIRSRRDRACWEGDYWHVCAY
jgi:hypothetical protein